jgi:hypothetical protein
MSSNIEVNDANKDKSDEELDDYMSNDFLNQMQVNFSLAIG